MHWFYDESFSQASSSISTDELRHFRSLRIKQNEEIAITDGRGAVFYCKAVNPETGEVEIWNRRTGEREAIKLDSVMSAIK